ncbi:hypothetical protein [Pseudoduganella violaceinigra]|uniref:hypothetical protein n=1 Tax=Pseudoduganella violaceinigra TaxID=246602 RepID=UPI000427FCFB|nr:hypothetical protein [Pseudoduganella violaceinigra]
MAKCRLSFRSASCDGCSRTLRLAGAPKVETVEKSGHYLQKDVPDEVANAIDSLR